jgi:antitoxin CcdA
MPTKPALPPPESKTAQWRRENLPAMEAWNKYVEEHGLPLAKFRQF